MTRSGTNPFTPGFGRIPEHLARRPEVDAVLGDVMARLQGEDPDIQATFLYGPRGNGKTALLRWLEDEVERMSGGWATLQVRLSATEMGSPVAIVQSMVNATFGSGNRVALTEEASAGPPRLGAVRIMAGDEPLSLAEVLARRFDPLLITLDEAHQAPPEMLGGLLDVVQIVGRRRSVAAVFAGSPSLPAVLRAANAGFWTAGRRLRIGPLSDSEAREALAVPFRIRSVEADPDAIAKLAAAADNCPYFLQLHGEAAWNVAAASRRRALRAEHVAPALAAAAAARQDYCLERHAEFADAGRLPLARSVAEAFVSSAPAPAPADRRLSDAEFEAILARHGDLREARAFLVASGYAWQDRPGDRSWAPGIPGLMDFMIENVPAG